MSKAESHRAPFLFINDIAEVCCGTVKNSLFADDLTLFSAITLDSLGNVHR